MEKKSNSVDSLGNMDSIIKYSGIGLLALSVVGFIVLSSTGMTTELIPIDQSKCPPNVGQAPDGTCGIYIGRTVTGWAYGCMVAGALGVILFIAGLASGRKEIK